MWAGILTVEIKKPKREYESPSMEGATIQPPCHQEFKETLSPLIPTGW